MMKKYELDDLVVLWKSDLCVHSGICVRGLGEVFDPNRRPWIDLSKAEKDEIVKQVKACPSGAISLGMAEQPDDQSSHLAVVEVVPDGPIKLTNSPGMIEVDGEPFEGKACFLCRCGASTNKPFCDGSHKKINFVG